MAEETQLSRARRPDMARLAAYRGFITAHAEIIAQIERDLAAAKVISITWYDVLIELYEAPDQRLRLGDLAKAVVLSRSGLTRTVDRLETAGLLRREPDPTDGRGAFAVLTVAGLAAMRRAWPIYASSITTFFACQIRDDEVAGFTEVCNRLLKGVREP